MRQKYDLENRNTETKYVFKSNIAYILRRTLKLNVFFRDNTDHILGRSMRLNMYVFFRGNIAPI